ncbi:hypothetical protein CBS101457_003234 [Exobasidium rhododendri]|nr:hypothetical protein CBS101457_003234 [Exobasidium rhododendri]
MFTSLRTPLSAKAVTVLGSQRSVAPRNVAFFSTAFRPSSVACKGEKNDPTPGDRGGSEQSMPGEASGGDIASSDAAYDSDKPRPQQTSNKMEKEKPVNMDRSAASSEPSDNASNGQSKQTTSQGEGGSQPGASGGPAVRRGNS